MDDWLVGVDAAVAEKWPVAAGIFEQAQIDFGDQDLFLVVGGFGDDAAEGVGDERSAPELQSRAVDAIAADVAMLFADAIDGADIDSVGDGVGALDGLPGLILRGAELFLLGRDASQWRWGRRARSRLAWR